MGQLKKDHFATGVYVTHSKIKNLLSQLYSWDFQAKYVEKTDAEEENDVIEIVLTEEDEESEVIRSKIKRKLPIIEESETSGDEDEQQEKVESECKRSFKSIVDDELEIDIIVDK